MKILLTGSSKGIGFNIASTLINEGHDIALHYNKNKSTLDDLLKDSKTNSFAIQSDLSDSSQVKDLVNNTIDTQYLLVCFFYQIVLFDQLAFIVTHFFNLGILRNIISAKLSVPIFFCIKNS